MSTQLEQAASASRPCPSGRGMRFGIVVSEWNGAVTERLLDAARLALADNGVRPDDVTVLRVPGSFELTAGARICKRQCKPDAIICLGCVVRGDTPHFDYVCQGVTHGLASLNAMQDTPVLFGVLTVDNQQQALDRAGGQLGNKGAETALAAIRMAALSHGMI